jgi:cysteine desulfurase / selenocysteine lyase
MIYDGPMAMPARAKNPSGLADEPVAFDKVLLNEIRSRFCHVDSDPYLGKRVYLENAGGSLTLQSVVDTQSSSASLPSNAGRDNAGSHAVEEYIAKGRDAVRDFLNADDGAIISCDSTTSHAFRVLEAATHLAVRGKNIVCTDLDHPAFYDAAGYYADRKGLVRRVAHMDPVAGTVPPDAVLDVVDGDTVAVTVIHASNITGGKNDLKMIVEGVRRKAPDAVIIADGAQHVQHGVADVMDLGVDAYIFSAYKVFSSPGYGFAYLSPRIASLPHARLAGKQADEWDMGTRDHTAFACFTKVVEYLCWLGRRVSAEGSAHNNRMLVKSAFRAIESHEMVLGQRLLNGITNLPGLLRQEGVEIYGEKAVSHSREAVYAFCICGLNAKDAVKRFGSRGIIVHDRSSDAYSGHTMTRLGVDSIVRVSLAHYTSIAEVDCFLLALNEIIEETRA